MRYVICAGGVLPSDTTLTVPGPLAAHGDSSVTDAHADEAKIPITPVKATPSTTVRHRRATWCVTRIPTPPIG
jgi:hypothetical protein